MTSACNRRWNGTSATVTSRYGVNVELKMDGDFDVLPDRYRTCVYRAVQEALTNCVRHAKARAINVSVTSHGDHLDVSVTDDGIGFDSARRGNGLGLRGIEERVKELHGVMTIEQCGRRRHQTGDPSAVCRHARRRCRLRVLLADDHSIVRRGLRSLLEEAGHSVVAEAADGLEAVRLCEEHRPDLAHSRHRDAETERDRGRRSRRRSSIARRA